MNATYRKDLCLKDFEVQRECLEDCKIVSQAGCTEQDLQTIFRVIDHTSLNTLDSVESILDLCSSEQLSLEILGKTYFPAALCVYPRFAAVLKERLITTPTRTAVVTGSFPHGLTDISSKCFELKALEHAGVDEVDTVLLRGAFLSGNFQEAFDDLRAQRESLSEKVHLKTILETGELEDPELIFQASLLALEAGADFIKTSTGKSPVSATPEAAAAMIAALKAFHQETGKLRGLKIAGGVSSIEDALFYYNLTKSALELEALDAKLFRIGSSKLLSMIKSHRHHKDHHEA